MTGRCWATGRPTIRCCSPTPDYPGPYQDRAKNLMGLTAIGTPNATTLVFHLQFPFPDLPYVLAFPDTAPVLPERR